METIVIASSASGCHLVAQTLKNHHPGHSIFFVSNFLRGCPSFRVLECSQICPGAQQFLVGAVRIISMNIVSPGGIRPKK